MSARQTPYRASARTLSGMGKKPPLYAVTVAVLAFAFLAAGCAAPDQVKASPATGDPVSEITPDVALCQGNVVPLEALENPRPATELGPEALPALHFHEIHGFGTRETCVGGR